MNQWCCFGASLGGAAAIDFAIEHPEAVDSLVVQNAQAYIDGIGLLSELPGFLQRLGTKLLKARWVRRSAIEMGYFDKELATEDALDASCIHTKNSGWTEAAVAFMKSGGYRISDRVKDVKKPTLIIWAKDDEVLDPACAGRFKDEIENSQLVNIKDCGHLGVLEKPEEMAQAVFQFLGVA